MEDQKGLVSNFKADPEEDWVVESLLNRLPKAVTRLKSTPGTPVPEVRVPSNSSVLSLWGTQWALRGLGSTLLLKWPS